MNKNKKINLNDHAPLHFIGIGGIGMSGIAQVLLKRGFEVTGSDVQGSRLITQLETLGASIQIGHDPILIDNAKGVVVSSAIQPDNKELIKAASKNIPVFKRAEVLNAVMTQSKYPVTVAGTHGKSTTSGYVAHMLVEAKKKPSFIIGAELTNLGT